MMRNAESVFGAGDIVTGTGGAVVSCCAKVSPGTINNAKTMKWRANLMCLVYIKLESLQYYSILPKAYSIHRKH